MFSDVTIGRIFDFGLDTMVRETAKAKEVFSMRDFANGGPMEKYRHYTVEAYEKEFSCELVFK